MCVFLYAQGASLRIEYASETIKLLPSLSSEIMLDMLVRNESDRPIAAIDALYPRALRRCRSWGNNHVTFEKQGHFNDSSQSLLAPNDHANRFLENPVHEFSRHQAGGRCTITYRERRDSSPALVGDVCGTCTLDFADFNPKDWVVLESIGFTPLRCTLQSPIPPGDARWLRWRIVAPSTPVNTRTRFGHLSDRLLDRLDHAFTIVGPTGTKMALESRLHAFIQRATGMQGHTEQHLGLVAQGLLGRFQAELSAAQTNIADWQINVFPGFFREVVNTSVEGSLRVVGTHPSRIDMPPDSGFWEACYQWRATSHEAPSAFGSEKPEARSEIPDIDVGDFTLSFWVKHPNRLIRALPWIAFLISLPSFIEWLLSVEWVRLVPLAD